MVTHRTDSIFIADLTIISSILLPTIQDCFWLHLPAPVSEEQIELAFDWIVTEALIEVLRQRGQYIEITHHFTHDIYKCIYHTPPIRDKITLYMAAWLDSHRLTFSNGTRVKLLVTYQQLILVRRL